MPFFHDLKESFKSLLKIGTICHPTYIPTLANVKEPLVILANGPSLNDTLNDYSDVLKDAKTLAVNFFAKTEAFSIIKPQYYVLADPHFFSNEPDANLTALRDSILSADWDMKLFVPCKFVGKETSRYKSNKHIKVYGFNFIGIEGFRPWRHFLYRLNFGMPRPRNVLIPSLMLGLAIGYKTIYISGADHSWMKTLSVTDKNEVVSIQPHFYADNNEETSRIASVYQNIHLHQVVESFAIAFRSYHLIAQYAKSRSASIYNSTPGSFIDAFERKGLPFDSNNKTAKDTI